jgi:hypothetical protein
MGCPRSVERIQPRWTHLPDAAQHRAPWGFSCMHGGEAVLNHGAHSCQLTLFLRRKILRGELGVRHQDFSDLHPSCRLHQGKDFMPSQVTGGKDHIMPHNQLQASTCGRRKFAPAIKNGDGWRRDSQGGHFALNFRPKWQLLVRAAR